MLTCEQEELKKGIDRALAITASGTEEDFSSVIEFIVLNASPTTALYYGKDNTRPPRSNCIV